MVKNKTTNLGHIPDMNSDFAEDDIGQSDFDDTAPLYDRAESLPVVVNMDPWDDLDLVFLNEEYLNINCITGGNPNQPDRAPFDVLRTRLLRILKENGWSRVAITSPTDGCGKSFIAANLALSMSRLENCRTILLDMNLRNPSLSKKFGVSHPNTMREYLQGEVTEKNFMFKVSDNLALGLNKHPEENAAELLQSTKTHDVLEVMRLELTPDIVLYDMPSVLYRDEVLSFLPQVDGVLLVVGGGQSTAADVKQVENLLVNQIPLLGVILNRDEG